MYTIKRESKTKNIKLNSLEGFLLPSKRKAFQIQGMNVSNICVLAPILAHPIVIKKVMQKYRKLIALLTELLISDDDTGDTFREALNQIEKFRQEVKNKYRAYLTKKELEQMSKQLKIFQLEAQTRFMELQASLQEISLESQRGKGR